MAISRRFSPNNEPFSNSMVEKVVIRLDNAWKHLPALGISYWGAQISNSVFWGLVSRLVFSLQYSAMRAGK